jgi:hypothetical protein
MPGFSLVGWSQSVETGGNLTEIDALADPHIRVEGKDVIVPSFLARLFAAYSLGPSTIDAVLRAPSFRASLGVPDLPIRPLDIGDAPSDPMTKVMEVDIPLVPNEKLNALFAELVPGAARNTVLAWLGYTVGFSNPPYWNVKPIGPMFHVQGTYAPPTAGVWTNRALTLPKLKKGYYAVVGARAFADAASLPSLVAFRLVFSGFPYRPGGLGFAATSASIKHASWYKQRYGGLGVWGVFDSDVPPTVDILGFAADPGNIGLDLVPVAPV